MKIFSDDEEFEVTNRKQALRLMLSIKKSLNWTETEGRGIRDNFPDQVKRLLYIKRYYDLQSKFVDKSFWVAFDWFGEWGRICVCMIGDTRPFEFDQICKMLDNEFNYKINIEKQFDL